MKLTWVALDVCQCELDFILCWNLFPCVQEDSLVHLTILTEINIHWNNTCEVEDVNIVFNSNL